MSVSNITAVHFADLNGDGRAEYLWVGEQGQVTAFLHLGTKAEGPTPTNVGWLD